MLSELYILKQSAEKAKQFIRHYIYFTKERDKSLTLSPIVIALVLGLTWHYQKPAYLSDSI